jgi:hypothetical protein
MNLTCHDVDEGSRAGKWAEGSHIESLIVLQFCNLLDFLLLFSNFATCLISCQ